MTTNRGTMWSGTQFVLEAFEGQQNAAAREGWTCMGQLEECPTTKKKHYQFAVKTPQVRMSKVISIFKGAHIEPCRNKDALLQYVIKEETRVGEMPTVSNKFPNPDQFFALVCKELLADNIPKEYRMLIDEGEWYKTKKSDDQVLEALDFACDQLIRAGYRIELHAVNPQIRSAWKKFSTAIAYRSIQDRQTDRQAEIISHEGSINDAGGEDNETSSCQDTETSEPQEGSADGSDVTTSSTYYDTEESSEGDSSERSGDKVRKQRARKSW